MRHAHNAQESWSGTGELFADRDQSGIYGTVAALVPTTPNAATSRPLFLYARAQTHACGTCLVGAYWNAAHDV